MSKLFMPIVSLHCPPTEQHINEASGKFNLIINISIEKHNGNKKSIYRVSIWLNRHSEIKTLFYTICKIEKLKLSFISYIKYTYLLTIIR